MCCLFRGSRIVADTDADADDEDGILLSVQEQFVWPNDEKKESNLSVRREGENHFFQSLLSFSVLAKQIMQNLSANELLWLLLSRLLRMLFSVLLLLLLLLLIQPLLWILQQQQHQPQQQPPPDVIALNLVAAK